MVPTILSGGRFTDERGSIFYNNDFVLDKIKRIYFIQNADCDFVRGWQGHKIESRWFSAVFGNFKILVAKVADLEIGNPIKVNKFLLNNPSDFLEVPPGFATAIQMTEPNSRLLVMADFRLKEMDDEYRFPFDNERITG